MKYIKRYSNYKQKPRIGDYVVCAGPTSTSIDSEDYNYLKYFIENNVGRIIDFGEYPQMKKLGSYRVKYVNIPKDIPKKYFLTDNSRFNEVSRLATPEEIEEYKYNENIDKFNI